MALLSTPGLNILDLVYELRDVEDETLQLQCDSFLDSMAEDDAQEADSHEGSHLSVFNTLFRKVRAPPKP